MPRHPRTIAPTSAGSYHRELDQGRRALEEAAAIALSYFGQELQVEHKPGDEPVTEADRECSRAIVERLTEDFPLDVFISEESQDDPARLSASRVWYIDPIDGTKDFIRERRGYGVVLGLRVDGRPVLGMVLQPATGSLFYASEGHGAWLSRGSELYPLRVSDKSNPREADMLLHRRRSFDEAAQLRQIFGPDLHLGLGSLGLKLCAIAHGTIDLYVNPASRSSHWDTCGPQVILSEAGGLLTDARGAPLDYSTESLRNERGLIASNGKMHAEAVGELASLFIGDEA